MWIRPFFRTGKGEDMCENDWGLHLMLETPSTSIPLHLFLPNQRRKNTSCHRSAWQLRSTPPLSRWTLRPKSRNSKSVHPQTSNDSNETSRSTTWMPSDWAQVVRVMAGCGSCGHMCLHSSLCKTQGGGSCCLEILQKWVPYTKYPPSSSPNHFQLGKSREK